MVQKCKKLGVSSEYVCISIDIQRRGEAYVATVAGMSENWAVGCLKLPAQF